MGSLAYSHASAVNRLNSISQHLHPMPYISNCRPTVAPAGAPAPSAKSAAANTPGQAAQFTKHEHQGGLRRADLDQESPIAQFHKWFLDASAPDIDVLHPETCTLSTASLPSGRISARMVYMKELDARGFVVYSNFGTSGKARDVLGVSICGSDDGSQQQPNPWASLVFFWEAMERQVRVEGRAERLTPQESQAYFDTRVRGSRIGAWASRQSAVLKPDPGVEGDDGRAQLEGWVKEIEDRFAGVEDIPCPEYWGGLRIVPERVEFWQGRQNRLHDRFVYDRVVREDGKESWTLERLSP